MIDGLTASDEGESERNGLLSTRTEWHATAIGTASGLLGGLLLGTPFESVGLGAMAVVGAAALGMSILTVSPSKAITEIHREPWYALGAMVLAFLPALAL